MILTVISTLIILIIPIVYYWFQQHFKYWSKQNVPTTNLLPFNRRLKLRNNFGEYLQKIYNEKSTKEEKIVGIYAGLRPSVMIKDTNMIEELLINDYEVNTKSSDHDLMSSMTMFRFNTQKARHKQFLPIFEEKNLKEMYVLIEKVAKDLEIYLLKRNDTFVTDINNMVSLYTSDITANLVFGSSSNCLKLPEMELYHKQVLQTVKASWYRLWKFYMVNFSPRCSKENNHIRIYDQEAENFLRIAANYVLSERKRRNVKRKDVINQLVKLQQEARDNNSYTQEQHDILIAMILGLYATLFDSSFTLTYTFYELARNSKVQEKLREEIRKALETGNGSITYDNLNSLEYLDMVLNEVLRLYPLYPFIYRKYHKSSHISLAKYLKLQFNYKPKNGLPIFIPIYALHRDDKLWPDPLNFDPERFSTLNKPKIHPMSYLPFGNNPYDCFGSHFIVLSIKLGLFYFLKNHYVRVCDQTKTELEFDPNSPTLRLKEDIYLEFVKNKLVQ